MEIISRFKDHHSIKIMKSHISLDDQKFSLKLATGNSIEKVINKLDTRTSVSFDSISPEAQSVENHKKSVTDSG